MPDDVMPLLDEIAELRQERDDLRAQLERTPDDGNRAYHVAHLASMLAEIQAAEGMQGAELIGDLNRYWLAAALYVRGARVPTRILRDR